MRVLLVHPILELYGGAEYLIVKLANFLSTKGIRNSLLTTAISREIQKDLTDTSVILTPSAHAGSRGFTQILALWQTAGKVMTDFDLMNVHNFPSELSSFKCTKPVVWMCNEPPVVHLALERETSFPQRLKKRALLMLDKFVTARSIRHVVVSDEFNAERFRSLYSHRHTLHIINYGVDFEFFSQGDGTKPRNELNLNDRFAVLQVGMLTPQKNQLESIRAVNALRQEIPPIRLILAGSGTGDYREEAERLIKELKLDEHVLITGHLDRKEIRDLYHACDVVLHPVKSQGGWLSPFEALCAGKPVVVSHELTAGTIIEREKIGVVTRDCITALRDIYKDRAQSRQMAERGQQWVKENLSWDKFGEEMLKVFHEAASQSP